ncbi:hypothetical protein Bca52824_027811 [Brassica carinata]|uniref:Uncharacterized protein n=1 Tax=Brassica carinata TaxID=52824 RepID=A0A8X8ANU3_BRACI|nr:hypothetical protein Bca52824_027811 [Brassica carinata]
MNLILLTLKTLLDKCLTWGWGNWLQVKNIAMEILDFYENYRTITNEKVSSAFNKLTLKQM